MKFVRGQRGSGGRIQAGEGLQGGEGLGMKLVDRRIKELLGSAFGIAVSCIPNQLTRVTVRIPAGGVLP